MCALGSKERIMEIIKGIKHSRAPGVDGVLTTMLKQLLIIIIIIGERKRGANRKISTSDYLPIKNEI